MKICSCFGSFCTFWIIAFFSSKRFDNTTNPDLNLFTNCIIITCSFFSLQNKYLNIYKVGCIHTFYCYYHLTPEMKLFRHTWAHVLVDFIFFFFESLSYKVIEYLYMILLEINLSLEHFTKKLKKICKGKCPPF